VTARARRARGCRRGAALRALRRSQCSSMPSSVKKKRGRFLRGVWDEGRQGVSRAFESL
jgi:hypothetical protein